MTRMMSSKMSDSSFDAMDKVHGAMDRPEGQKQNINSKHIFEGALGQVQAELPMCSHFPASLQKSASTFHTFQEDGLRESLCFTNRCDARACILAWLPKSPPS